MNSDTTIATEDVELAEKPKRVTIKAKWAKWNGNTSLTSESEGVHAVKKLPAQIAFDPRGKKRRPSLVVVNTSLVIAQGRLRGSDYDRALQQNIDVEEVQEELGLHLCHFECVEGFGAYYLLDPGGDERKGKRQLEKRIVKVFSQEGEFSRGYYESIDNPVYFIQQHVRTAWHSTLTGEQVAAFTERRRLLLPLTRWDPPEESALSVEYSEEAI